MTKKNRQALCPLAAEVHHPSPGCAGVLARGGAAAGTAMRGDAKIPLGVSQALVTEKTTADKLSARQGLSFLRCRTIRRSSVWFSKSIPRPHGPRRSRSLARGSASPLSLLSLLRPRMAADRHSERSRASLLWTIPLPPLVLSIGFHLGHSLGARSSPVNRSGPPDGSFGAGVPRELATKTQRPRAVLIDSSGFTPQPYLHRTHTLLCGIVSYRP